MYGLNIDILNEGGKPPVSQLKELGVDTVRFSYKDKSMGMTLNPEIYSKYVAYLKELQAAKIRALIILAYEVHGDKPHSSASDEAWGKYIDNFVLRVGQVASALIEYEIDYQVWNEPDLPSKPDYDPTLRPAVYGRLLARSRSMLKQYAPAALVVGAGLCSGKPEYWTQVVNSQPGVPLLDANGLHPYGQQPEPGWPEPGWGFGEVGELVRAYQRVFNGPWWVSECGTDTLTPEMQGQYLTKMYGRLTSPEFYWPTEENGIKRVIWFCYGDQMVKPFGLLFEDSRPKPAYDAYRRASGAL